MNKAGLALVMATLSLLVGCPMENEPTPEDTVLVAVGEPAPHFEVTTIDGATFSLDEQRGRVVLVNFFATWCPPCRDELPYLEREIWQRFDDGRFALIVVGREEGDEVLAPFVEQHGFTFPVAGDPDRSVYSRYASRYIPRNVVIGPDGTVLFQSQGFERKEFETMIAVIERALDSIGEAA